ncbi:MAG TPA: hypothetical protein VNS19_18480 [Acidimicrobiales bacterium]|nr:hypothetical protein [Acidimicrobiales bacterium]
MSDDPIDPAFGQELAARLHEAADPVDGAGVTRAGVAAVVERRRDRHARTRALVLGAAAVVVLLAGLAAFVRSGGDAPEQVVTATPSTTEAACVPAPVVTAPAGWFRLSAEQADALLAAGAITRDQADQRAEHAVLLTHDGLQVLSDPEVGPLGDQLRDLGYEDSAGIELLRSEGLLTPEQETAVADRIAPVLEQAQVDRVFDAFPDLLAIAAGGQPFPSAGGTGFSPSGGAATTTEPAGSGGGCEAGG